MHVSKHLPISRHKKYIKEMAFKIIASFTSSDSLIIEQLRLSGDDNKKGERANTTHQPLDSLVS